MRNILNSSSLSLVIRQLLINLLIMISFGAVDMANANNANISVNGKLQFQSFFDGEMKAWGSIFGFTGSRSSNFHLKMLGNWDDKKGKLEEWFIFDDGSKLERIWYIDSYDKNGFVASAIDVKGKANGVYYADSINAKYDMEFPFAGTQIVCAVDDWMYRLDDQHFLNRIKIKKLGLQVAEIVIFIEKLK